LGSLDHGQVGPREVRRAAEELRKPRYQRLQHVLRGLARGDGFALGVELFDESADAAFEILRQRAGDAALELGGVVRELLLVGRNKPGPFLLGLLPRFTRVPSGADRLRSLAGRGWPAC